MTHEEAVELKAPERYVIGDLSVAERDTFEEHFACCSQCLEEVWTASTFAANARAVFRERAARPSSRQRVGWLAWLRPPVLIPSFAALALAVVVVYQGAIVIPGLRAPQAITHSIILDGATRAGAPQTPAGSPLRFQIALGSVPVGGLVRVELHDTSGKVVGSGVVKSPPPEQPLDVYFPIRLNPGRYSIVIRPERSGQGEPELARSPFEVVAKEPDN